MFLVKEWWHQSLSTVHNPTSGWMKLKKEREYSRGKDRNVGDRGRGDFCTIKSWQNQATPVCREHMYKIDRLRFCRKIYVWAKIRKEVAINRDRWNGSHLAAETTLIYISPSLESLVSACQQQLQNICHFRFYFPINWVRMNLTWSTHKLPMLKVYYSILLDRSSLMKTCLRVKPCRKF